MINQPLQDLTKKLTEREVIGTKTYYQDGHKKLHPLTRLQVVGKQAKEVRGKINNLLKDLNKNDRRQSLKEHSSATIWLAVIETGINDCFPELNLKQRAEISNGNKINLELSFREIVQLRKDFNWFSVREKRFCQACALSGLDIGYVIRKFKEKFKNYYSQVTISCNKPDMIYGAAFPVIKNKTSLAERNKAIDERDKIIATRDAAFNREIELMKKQHELTINVTTKPMNMK